MIPIKGIDKNSLRITMLLYRNLATYRQYVKEP